MNKLIETMKKINNFTKVPRMLLFQMDGKVLKLFIYLLDNYEKQLSKNELENGFCTLSQQIILQNIHLTVGVYRRALEALHRKGLVEVIVGNNFKGCSKFKVNVEKANELNNLSFEKAILEENFISLVPKDERLSYVN